MTPPTTSRARRHGYAPFVPLLAVAVLLILAAMARPGLAGLTATVGETATPTKTPRPFTPAPAITPLELVIVMPTATVAAPAPAPAAATPLPPAAATAQPLTAYLAEIAARYQMDLSRRFIVVDPNYQRMTIWEPGRPVREFPISTGDEGRGYRTLAWYGLVGKYWGTFNAFGVYADDGWYLYEDAGSILVHGAPYKLENGVKVYQDLDALGNYPASRGCIRLRPQDAQWFTEWNPEGTPMVVLPRRNS